MLDFFVPRALAEPTRYHENPEQSEFDRTSRQYKLATLLHLALRLSEPVLHADGAINDDAGEIDGLYARLELPKGHLATVFNESLIQWREWSELLDLPTDRVPNFEHLRFLAAGPERQARQQPDDDAARLYPRLHGLRCDP